MNKDAKLAHLLTRKFAELQFNLGCMEDERLRTKNREFEADLNRKLFHEKALSDIDEIFSLLFYYDKRLSILLDTFHVHTGRANPNPLDLFSLAHAALSKIAMQQPNTVAPAIRDLVIVMCVLSVRLLTYRPDMGSFYKYAEETR